MAFIGSVLLTGFLLNKGNVNTTKEMEMATFPVIYMNIDGKTVNRLYGYADDMEERLLRENITPLSEDRGVSLRIVKYGRMIDSIKAMIRTVDGGRLIETIDVTDYVQDDYGITVNLNFKDLISSYTEYCLEIYLDIGNGKPILYRTTVIDAPSYCAKEKLDFVMDFHEKSLKRETAEELKTYMETNSMGDNSSFAYVNIHSSLDQLAYGNLRVSEATEPVCLIKELAQETAVFLVDFMAQVVDENVTRKYFVEEYYRIKLTTENTYLLDFERTMHQIPDEDRISPALDTILLGISGPDVTLNESADGNVVAFVDENRLFSYNISENEMAVLFSFYDKSNFDERTYHNAHKIKVLSVDEAGNVRFLVYGYMNRGDYEGRVGFVLYEYNGLTNELRDILFVPSKSSPEIVMKDMDELSYLSTNNIFFFMMDRAIYSTPIDTPAISLIVSDLKDNMYSISDSQSMAVWQMGESVNNSSALSVMNLNTYQISEIKAEPNQFIKPLAFMGEDFIYGLAYMRDVLTDNTGRTIFPMYCMKIVNEYGELMKTYEENGMYVSDVNVVGNLLTLKRVKKADKDYLAYVDEENDYMTNNQQKDTNSNVIETVDNGDFERVTQIRLCKDASGKTIWRTPREVIYEGSRELYFERAQYSGEFYYVYFKGYLQKISTNATTAVSMADENFGHVMNSRGFYIWYRANRELRNQIMSLSLDKLVDDEEDELSCCMDKLLEYEEVVRNSKYLLSHGATVLSVLRDNLENKDVLDLKGCSLDSVLYYVNRDIPVLAMTHTEKTYLIIGFNQLSIVLFDPDKGTYKIGRNEAEAMFLENGNQFITYVENESK